MLPWIELKGKYNHSLNGFIVWSNFIVVRSSNISEQVRVQNIQCASIERCGEIFHHTKCPLRKQKQVTFHYLKYQITLHFRYIDSHHWIELSIYQICIYSQVLVLISEARFVREVFWDQSMEICTLLYNMYRLSWKEERRKMPVFYEGIGFWQCKYIFLKLC